MQRRTRAWALLSTATCALACSSTSGTSEPGTSTGGSPASGGLTASAGSGGMSSSGGAAAGTPSTSGSGGQGGAAAGSTAGGTAGATSLGGAGSSAGGAAGSAGSGGSDSGLPKRVLLYHFSTLVIDSVPAQLMLLKQQLQTWGYEVEDSIKPDDVSTTNLARFAAVGMINTCFEPFGVGKTGETQTAALKAFVEAGGGLFGTHCASVTFQAAQPPNPYNVLIGGRGGHGSFDGMSACRTVEAHPTTMMLPATFDFNGNLDNADYVADDSTVLVKCKWSGGDMKDTAVSWYRTPGKGRVFYTNFAKVDADLSSALLGQKHIFAGLGWVLGR